MFRGVLTALVTPFRDGELDEDAFRQLVEWQVAEGIHGLVIAGTTGEAPTLSEQEYKRIIKIAVQMAKSRVPVIAGTGTNSTSDTIATTQIAKELGADAALVVTPYYNKPTQEGLRRHFEAIHEAVELPIIIYNIPARSVVDMTVATMAGLAGLPRVVGVKDATNDLVRPLQTRLACGDDFVQLTGENPTFAAFLAQGGDGGILVTSNVAPRALREMFDAWEAHDQAKFSALNRLLFPLHDALFLETNPSPVKYALSQLGKCTPEVRLPLCEVSSPTRRKVDAALRRLARAGYVQHEPP